VAYARHQARTENGDDHAAGLSLDASATIILQASPAVKRRF
jgi:hypothetical protein